MAASLVIALVLLAPLGVLAAMVGIAVAALRRQEQSGTPNRIAQAVGVLREWLWPFDALEPVDDNDLEAEATRLRNRWKLIHVRPYATRWALVAIGLVLCAELLDQGRIAFEASGLNAVAGVFYLLGATAFTAGMASTVVAMVLLAIWWRWGLGR